MLELISYFVPFFEHMSSVLVCEEPLPAGGGESVYSTSFPERSAIVSVDQVSMAREQPFREHRGVNGIK